MEFLETVKNRLQSANKLTVVLVSALALLIGWILWPQTEAATIAFEPEELSGASNAEISVHLVGEVVNPGLYQLPIGSRVNDVVDIAGGLKANASVSSVNLARILVDGEQVVIKSEEKHQEELDAKISINDADVEKLDSLPGVGPSIAARIIEHREQNGPFRSVEQLTEVSGIGPKMLSNIKDLVRL